MHGDPVTGHRRMCQSRGSVCPIPTTGCRYRRSADFIRREGGGGPILVTTRENPAAFAERVERAFGRHEPVRVVASQPTLVVELEQVLAGET